MQPDALLRLEISIQIIANMYLSMAPMDSQCLVPFLFLVQQQASRGLDAFANVFVHLLQNKSFDQIYTYK